MMPAGSVSADHEIGNGDCTLLPLAGARSVGATGAATAGLLLTSPASSRTRATTAARILMRFSLGWVPSGALGTVISSHLISSHRRRSTTAGIGAIELW